MHIRKLAASALTAGLLTAGGALLTAGGALLTAGTASAAPALPPGGCTAFSVPAADQGFQSPIHGGVVIDAVNWGGGGSAASACTGAQVNDGLVVWQPHAGNGHVGAGVAADFTPVAISFPAGDNSAAATDCGLSGTQTVTTASNCFELVYTPGNQDSGLCVSTITNVDGSYARLRVCASRFQSGLSTAPAGFSGTNQWQDFKTVPQGDGFFQLNAALSGGFDLNIKGWGGNGTPVITYQTEGAAENQIWETVTAP